MKCKLNFVILIIILTFISCNSRKQILDLEKSGYKVYFQENLIKFKNLHISNKKIKSIKNIRESTTIEIYPTANVKIISAESLSNELKFLGNKNYELIIINGIPYEKPEFKNALIDFNSINEVTILKWENANKLFDRRFKEDILIIKTKR